MCRATLCAHVWHVTFFVRYSNYVIPEPTEAQVRKAGRTIARLGKMLEVVLAEADTSLPQYRLLAFLSGGTERARDLARMLEVSPPSLTALVDNTVAKGLVERHAAEGDRRAVHHVLTPAGEQALSDADAAIVEHLSHLLQTLDLPRRAFAVEGLLALSDALERRHEQNRALAASR